MDSAEGRSAAAARAESNRAIVETLSMRLDVLAAEVAELRERLVYTKMFLRWSRRTRGTARLIAQLGAAIVMIEEMTRQIRATIDETIGEDFTLPRGVDASRGTSLS